MTHYLIRGMRCVFSHKEHVGYVDSSFRLLVVLSSSDALKDSRHLSRQNLTSIITVKLIYIPALVVIEPFDMCILKISAIIHQLLTPHVQSVDGIFIVPWCQFGGGHVAYLSNIYFAIKFFMNCRKEAAIY